MFRNVANKSFMVDNLWSNPSEKILTLFLEIVDSGYRYDINLKLIIINFDFDFHL